MVSRRCVGGTAEALTDQATGIAIGLFAALELTRVLKSMLVDVKPTDPATFIAIVVLFFPIAAVASWAPAQRAATLDPIEALREE